MSRTKYEKKCENCGKDFVCYSNKKQRFCSQKCSIEYKMSQTRKEINGIVYKKCCKCEQWKEANSDNFQLKKQTIDGFSYTCKECENRKKRERYRNDEEYRKSRLNVDKEKKKKIRHSYYLRNRDKEIERAKKYNEENRDIIRERERKYRNTKNGKISNKLKSTKRRTRLKNLENNFTIKDWEFCKEYFTENSKLKCAYCNKELQRATIEHFIPVSKGGTTTRNNILPVCRSCNSSKQDKDFLEWYKTKPFYNEKSIEKINSYFEHLKTIPSHD